MSVAELVSKLIAAGTPPEVAACVVAEAFAAGMSTGLPRNSAHENRKTYDRERKRKQRNSTGLPPDSTGHADTALTEKKDTEVSKKVRARKGPCPPDWKPNEEHYAKAAVLNIPKAAVDAKAEDMRIWAAAKDERRSDNGWNATFHGFLRRDAPKLAVVGNLAKTTITPESPSWNAWKAYFRDTRDFRGGLMDKSAADGKAFTVPSEYPPGYKRDAA